LQAKLHKDNSLLVQNLIAAFKPNSKEMFFKIITGGLGQSSSGKRCISNSTVLSVKFKVNQQNI
jgi:hypothetical protein